MRILCLDIGTKRIGVAVSDELGVIAQGVETITRTSIKADITAVANLINKFNATKIVVGIPYNLKGEESQMSRSIKKFIGELKRTTGIDVVEWDERFSTIAVSKVLRETEMSRLKRQKVVDKLSAIYILQGYLDSGKQDER